MADRRELLGARPGPMSFIFTEVLEIILHNNRLTHPSGPGTPPLRNPGSATTEIYLLVSTYVVCERLSVMHEPAGVVENLVQILQNTPILKFRIPPLKIEI